MRDKLKILLKDFIRDHFFAPKYETLVEVIRCFRQAESGITYTRASESAKGGGGERGEGAGLCSKILFAIPSLRQNMRR